MYSRITFFQSAVVVSFATFLLLLLFMMLYIKQLIKIKQTCKKYTNIIKNKPVFFLPFDRSKKKKKHKNLDHSWRIAENS